MIWALGDLFNLVGAVLANLVPTVIALAVYFTFSDTILIGQCLYYNHWVNASKEVEAETLTGAPGQPRARRRRVSDQAVADDNVEEEDQPLLSRQESNRSYSSIGLPGSHVQRRKSVASSLHDAVPGSTRSMFQATLLNTGCVIGVCAVGAFGWFLAYASGAWTPVPSGDSSKDDESQAKFGAELLGYLSAVLYLGARIPQIIKNWKEKSCEGLSLLFFILSLLGNATYGAGILAHSLERQYVLTNVPWLLGSLGTMFEDIIIFVQFRLYRDAIH